MVTCVKHLGKLNFRKQNILTVFLLNSKYLFLVCWIKKDSEESLKKWTEAYQKYQRNWKIFAPDMHSDLV